MNGKSILIGIAIVVLVGAGYMLLDNDNGSAPETSPTPTASGSVSPTVTPGATATTSPKATATVSPVTGAVKTFNVIGTPFAFNVTEMKVKKGDKVRVTFTNQQGSHDWVIDEFNARTAILAAGKAQTIEFVADKTGTFEYYCSVGTHRQMGMKGKLIVE